MQRAAYASGALISLKYEGIIQGAIWEHLHNTTQQLESDIFKELQRLRERMQGNAD